MLKIKITYYTPTTSELFFIEKSKELLHPKTLDSYRLKMHNPLTAICELSSVLLKLEKGVLKNKIYAETSKQEVAFLLDTEKDLAFDSISKKYYEKLLSEKGDNFMTIYHASNYVIADNKNYTDVLFDKISAEIIRINALPNPLVVSEFDQLNRLTEYFYIELINRGFSKTYINYFFSSIFFGRNKGHFSDRLQILKTLVTRPSEKFNVIFALKSHVSKTRQISILDSRFYFADRKIRKDIVRKTNSSIGDFFTINPDCTFYGIEINAMDFYSAIKQARNVLQTLLDTVHMGHSDAMLVVSDDCAVFGEIEPTRASVEKVKYYIDGFYKSEQELYKHVVEMLEAINERPIAESSKGKIFSGLRYLRLGFEAAEIENKLLNYWIGLEYIFSPTEDDSNTIGRLRRFYKKCHAVSYYSRNLKSFHRSIKTLGLQAGIPNYNANLQYLTDPSTYDVLIGSLQTNPLIAFRANSIKEQLLSAEKIKAKLIKHQNNLEWNLIRTYRLRNEIVHNATFAPNIESITSHLRYYLIFLINGILHFLNNETIDPSEDNCLSVDDYFAKNELLLENIQNDKTYQSFEKLLKFHNPIDYLT